MGRTCALISVPFMVVGLALASSRPAVIVTISNGAPHQGTAQTPVWVGFHDGSFDSYDGGSPADSLPIPGSVALERLAEDGNTGPISADFDTLVPDGVQATVASNGPIPPLAPGQVVSRLFEVDADDHRYFSYVSMVLPSNDAFVANGSPFAHEIFDGDGDFVAEAFVVPGAAVNDAGTEVNDEIPENTAFFGQTMPDTGVDENGVVFDHPGFIPGGPILSSDMFSNGDFLADGYEILRFSFAYIDAAENRDFIALLNGAQEEPPADTNGFGKARLRLRRDGTRLRVNIRVEQLSGPVVAAHLHLGPPNQNGAVVADLSDAINNNNGRIRTTLRADDIVGPLAGGPFDPFDSLIAELVSGGVYINIHTEAFPGGEIRGQVILDFDDEEDDDEGDSDSDSDSD